MEACGPTMAMPMGPGGPPVPGASPVGSRRPGSSEPTSALKLFAQRPGRLL